MKLLKFILDLILIIGLATVFHMVTGQTEQLTVLGLQITLLIKIVLEGFVTKD